MDMFPDTALVREIQQELDNIIQQGVRNITRLIRATDPTGVEPQTSRRGRAAAGAHGGGSGTGPTVDGSLASRLVRDGLLSSDLLQQLQREWSKNQQQSVEHPNNNAKGKKRKKKK